MTEYFYTNSLDAFYMEQKWGVKYKGEIGGSPINVTPKSGVIRIGDHLRLLDKCPVLMAFVPEPNEPDTEWIVHEDSVHLFEPQLADLISWDRAWCGRIDGVNMNNVLVWFADKDDHMIIPRKEAKTIQRNNKTFIMPEVRSR